MPSVTLGSAGSADRRQEVGKRLPRAAGGRQAAGSRLAAPGRAKATGILGESGQRGPMWLCGGAGLVAGRPGVDLPRVCRPADLCNTLYDPRPTAYGRSGEDNNRRKPMSPFVSEGEFQLRLAERAYSGPSYQEPPRTTRDAPLLAVSANLNEPSKVEGPALSLIHI